LLENYLGWIPPTATETRGVTLTNLSLLTARRGDLAKARAYLKRLDAIPEADWPTRRVFGSVVRAQLAMVEGKARSARYWINIARKLVDALSPDDEWRHREELGLLEAELDRGRSA
jgi:Flp pilus assembly protein TadD